MSFKKIFKGKLCTFALFVVFAMSIVTPAMAADVVTNYTNLLNAWKSGIAAGKIDIEVGSNILFEGSDFNNVAVTTGALAIDGQDYKWDGNKQFAGICINADSAGSVTGTISNITMNQFAYSWGYGGAIYNARGTITLTGTTFSNNSAYSGGAILNQHGTINFYGNTIFSDNTATYGGAINSSGTINFYGNTTFSDNTATYGGAINNGGTINFYGNTSFSGNRKGAGPYAPNDIENVPGCILNFFEDSVTTFSDGGGITGDNGTGTIYFNAGAIITMNDLNWKGEKRDTFKTLNISSQNFYANGGIFEINTDLKGTPGNTGDTITLTNCTITASEGKTPLVYVQVAYDPTAIDTGQDVTGAEHIFLKSINAATDDAPATITVAAKAYDYSFNGKKLTITPTVENGDGGTGASDTWKITALTVVQGGADETTKAVSDTANLMNFAWFQTVNNLQKRLGDLRGGEASNMAWARFQRNNDDVNVGRTQSLSGNLYQIGYDFLIKSNDVAKNYFGLSVDVFDGSQSFEIGGGDAKSTTTTQRSMRVVTTLTLSSVMADMRVTRQAMTQALQIHL